MTYLSYFLDWALCLYITDNYYTCIKLDLHCVNHNTAGHNELLTVLISAFLFFIPWTGDQKKKPCLSVFSSLYLFPVAWIRIHE